MDGLAQSAGLIDETPPLKPSLWRLCKNSVLNIFEASTIDQPLAIYSLEANFVVDNRVGY